tara:strand:- start:900 stop:1397 length:498 start_codon:yes stop_codon:yes gene_type:complete
METKMKLLFENFRKYINENEVDTDDDGSLDPEELRAMAADLEGGEIPASADTSEIDEKSKSWIKSYLRAWFNQYEIVQYADTPEKTAKLLAIDLRKGANGESHNSYSTKVDFNKALRLDNQIPEDQIDNTASLLNNLADKVEQDPNLATMEQLVHEGDWVEVARS